MYLVMIISVLFKCQLFVMFTVFRLKFGFHSTGSSLVQSISRNVCVFVCVSIYLPPRCRLPQKPITQLKITDCMVFIIFTESTGRPIKSISLNAGLSVCFVCVCVFVAAFLG